MNKKIFTLFLIINFTLLIMNVTPFKLLLFLLVSILVLTIYKKLFGFGPLDQFKVTNFSII